MSRVPEFSFRQCSGRDRETSQVRKPLGLFPGYERTKDEYCVLGSHIGMANNECCAG